LYYYYFVVRNFVSSYEFSQLDKITQLKHMLALLLSFWF
jgi:hypothetical protein